MKKRSILLGAVLAGVLFAGCGNSGTKENTEPEGGTPEIQADNEERIENGDVNEIAKRLRDSYDICAIIREIGDGKVVLDTVEFITLDDTERMAELELTEADFPNGYYIYNADETTKEYTLADNAEFHFIDWGGEFVEEGAEDINVSTTDRAIFEKYTQSYVENKLNILFFFNLDGEQITSITEEALTSM